MSKWLVLALVLVVVTLGLLVYVFLPTGERTDIDYYVVTMGNPERLENIRTQQNVAGVTCERIDAVIGNKLHMETISNYNPRNGNRFNPDNTKREVGCYMSHLKFYNIVQGKNKSGYSVVLEDDVELYPEFKQNLYRTLDQLENVEFDILMLGMLNGEGGDHVVGNVYTIPKHQEHTYGTHAYLVNNKSIQKIISHLKSIENLIDVSIYDKGKSGELIVFTVVPTIANTVDTIPSTIR